MFLDSNIQSIKRCQFWVKRCRVTSYISQGLHCSPKSQRWEPHRLRLYGGEDGLMLMEVNLVYRLKCKSRKNEEVQSHFSYSDFLKYKGMKYKGYYFIAPMYIVRILLESRWYIQMGGQGEFE